MGPSGMMFHKIDHLKIQCSKGNKTRAGSYIPTPTIIKNKNGVVNIRNKTDDMCIIWCLLAHKYYDKITHNKKSENSTYKKYFDEIIQPKDIKYPIDIQKDIPKFEKLNNIKINVLEYTGALDKDYDKNKIVSVYNTRSRNENVINLLFLKDGNKEHLVWIKDYGKFQCMDYKSCKMYWCSQCLNCSFDSQEN